MPGPGELTSLLLRYQGGDLAAGDELVPLVYDELHRLARRAMSKLPPGQTLQATALLSEAWVRVGAGPGAEFANREHFLAVSARAMRSIVVDRARRRAVERREGNHVPIELDQAVDALEHGALDLLALDEEMNELARVRPELARIVELRFFAGMTHLEIAQVLNLSLRQVERHWGTARAWLYARLADRDGDTP